MRASRLLLARQYAAPARQRAAVSAAARRSHYSYSSPGQYMNEQLKELWKGRDFDRRGFTVGIGGPVGSGKTALVHQLCLALQETNLAVVTNDIFTQEDAEFLVRQAVLPRDRIKAVETGGCPHAAIREDVSANLSALEELTKMHQHEHEQPLLLLCESGGDNLAANFSRELADLTIYVIDVAGGDKVPRKGGPGITQSDLLIINKIDLAEAVGSDLSVMQRDAEKMRGGHGVEVPGPIVFAAVKHGTALPEIRDFVLDNFQRAMQVAAASKKE